MASKLRNGDLENLASTGTGLVCFAVPAFCDSYWGKTAVQQARRSWHISDIE
jgi:hypothetical protein